MNKSMDDFYRHQAERKKPDTKKYIVNDSYRGISRTDETYQIRGCGVGGDGKEQVGPF